MSHTATRTASIIECASAILAVALAVALGTADGVAQDVAPEAEVPSTPAEAETPVDVSPDDAIAPPVLLGALEIGPVEHIDVPIVVSAFIRIEADGSVSEVELESETGPEATAVVEALRAARFRPAMRGQTPMAVRIRYQHHLNPPPPPPAPLPGRLVVDVRGPEDAPLASAVVHLSTGETIRTGADGTARWDELDAGTVRVRINADDYVAAAENVVVVEGEEVMLRLRLQPVQEPAATDDAAYGAVAIVEAPPREITRRTIEREELLSVAGTRGDPLRAIELLPGVARPPQASGELIVRGSAPTDTQVYLEGAPVPLLYHFGGLTSFFQGRLIDQIDFYPGNFSVRYGRRIGASIEVSVRDERPESIGGLVDINLVDANLMFRTPLGERGGLAVAARRSYLDAFLGAALSGADGLQVTAAPVYWDYQAIATYEPTSSDHLRLMAYGSSDRMKILFADPGDADPGFRGGIGVRSQFHRVDLHWQRELSDAVTQELSFNTGVTNIGFNIGPNIEFENDYRDINARAEWRMRLGERVSLNVGADLRFAPFDIAFSGPPPEQAEGTASGPMGLDTIAGQERTTVDTSGVLIRPAIYIESELDLDPLRIVAGVRADHWGISIQSSEPITTRWTVDPRLSAILALPHNTRLKAAVGLFSQAPEFNEQNHEIGNGSLRPIRAVHLTVGADHEPADGVRIGVEGFYKRLWDRVVSTPDGSLPRYTNDGIGRIFGLEISGRIQPRAFGRHFSGFLSYTLSRSERRDLPGDEWRLFDFDQTHIFTFAGTVRFNRGWELGATFRLVSGNPRTPVTGGVYDLNNDAYSGIPGALNSQRERLFNRLDIRLQKTWTYQRGGRLSLYLDVQNVYNQQNSEGRVYSYDFTESDTLVGLPIIPSIGLRGEL